VIFVDSSFWIAQAMPRDGRYPDAAQLTGMYDTSRLVTSSLVLSETWTFLRRREGHERAFAWLDRIRGDVRVRMERIESDDEQRAWTWLRLHDERPYSFVDATSFALMRKLRLREALAFDGDFAAAGFVELRP
jgi:predicted nucleic acid-binding protein